MFNPICPMRGLGCVDMAGYLLKLRLIIVVLLFTYAFSRVRSPVFRAEVIATDIPTSAACLTSIKHQSEVFDSVSVPR